MSEPASLTTGIASRYAAAVFDLALDQGALATLDSDVAALDQALKDSADLRNLIASPIFTREDMGAAISAVARQMGLSVMMQNTLALMAQKRRLFVLPRLVAVLRDRIAAHRGEVTAEVTSARPLSDAQAADLARTLSDRVGKTVKLVTSVDDSLIGGLVVKVGSTMIDTSIRSRLAALQNTMKEVG